MDDKKSFIKALCMALAAAFLAHQLGKKEAQHHPTKQVESPMGWQPLAPIRKLFWLLHPQRALYFFLLQQSLGVTWSIAKKYFSSKP